MSVFHCPLCPLIFQHRTEVEHHLRNDHRSRAEEEAALVSELAAVSWEPTAERLEELTASRAGTAVTILLATTPAPSMSSLDVARLRRLAHQARRTVASEPGSVPAAIEERLSRAVAAAEGVVTHEGLAVMVNADHLAIFRLPFEPTDRVVVDASFATRDLEVTLSGYPRYRLVVLGSRPRLFEGRGLHLDEIDPPSDRHSDARDARRPVRPGRWAIGRARRQEGVHLADEAVTRRSGTHGELPLIVAGDGRWRAQFRGHTRHGDRIAGELPNIRGHDPAPRLAELAQPHLALLPRRVLEDALTGRGDRL